MLGKNKRLEVESMGAPVGNHNAKAAREWREALRRAMAHKAEGDYRATLQKIAEGVVDAALAGEKDAWQEIANREDGKAVQPIAGSEEDPAVQLEIGWRKHSS